MPKREYEAHGLVVLREMGIFREVQCSGCQISWMQKKCGDEYVDVVHPEESYHPCCCLPPEELAKIRLGEESPCRTGLDLLTQIFPEFSSMPREERILRDVRILAKQLASMSLYEIADAISVKKYRLALEIYDNMSEELRERIPQRVITFLEEGMK